MGFQKPDLTASVNSIEKVATETTEKEAEESKPDKIETIEVITPVITENPEVSITITITSQLNSKAAGPKTNFSTAILMSN